MPEWLCEICWIQTKTFHQFYKRVETRHGNYCSSNALVSTDSIKQERSDSPIDDQVNLELPIDIVKQEETDLLHTKEENCNDEAFVARYCGDGNGCDNRNFCWFKSVMTTV